jgi:DNA segregation ATPase FtsK/SpoIIIE-like protein
VDDEYVIEQATELARQSGGVRVSMLQRRMRIGYVQAARCVDIMQERGIIDATQLVAPLGYKYIAEANAALTGGEAVP